MDSQDSDRWGPRSQNIQERGPGGGGGSGVEEGAGDCLAGFNLGGGRLRCDTPGGIRPGSWHGNAAGIFRPYREPRGMLAWICPARPANSEMAVVSFRKTASAGPVATRTTWRSLTTTDRRP